MPIKIRKTKHRFPKELGYPDEKWARGGGRRGYGRSYGLNKYRGFASARTPAELKKKAADDDAISAVSELK